ncbi:DUF6318 family protein [Georgenia sp. M64]|uniref:DUF6318 family protein n=1 Tax=Georgenia sp. M64 TaxID=3120520 RepID=UPI0030E05594
MVLGERRPRTIVGATAALTLSILLGGCTDGSAGTPTPTVSASEAPSVEPSSAAPEPTTTAPSAEVEKPVPPEAMRRDDVAGAEAAAQYFLKLYQYAYASGSTAEIRAMSDPECDFCTDVVSDVEELYGAGGSAEGGDFSVLDATAHPPLQGNEYFRVDLLAEEGPSRRVEGSGSSSTASGGRSVLIFAIGRAVDEWLVREVQVEDGEALG